MRKLLVAFLLSTTLPASALACSLPAGHIVDAALYYELGSSKLTMSGQQTVDLVAEQVVGCPVMAIAAGHVDASELETSPRLGQARAEDVRDRLVAAGLQAQDVLLRDQAFKRPAEPTRSGISSPRNRRVQLVVVVL